MKIHKINLEEYLNPKIDFEVNCQFKEGIVILTTVRKNGVKIKSSTIAQNGNIPKFEIDYSEDGKKVLLNVETIIYLKDYPKNEWEAMKNELKMEYILYKSNSVHKKIKVTQDDILIFGDGFSIIKIIKIDF